MQTIFSYGLATGKHAMGSAEPLGSAKDVETQESEEAEPAVDFGGGTKADNFSPKAPGSGERERKRKRGCLGG